MVNWLRISLAVALALATLALLPAPRARAGGYDTPMLYSARHMGMGGTAVAYVHDPSALFHNPAGLGRVDNVSLLGNFSLLVGGIQGSPARHPAGTSIDSNTTIAPFPLLGGAVRITDWLVAGFALYPVAAAGATYEYLPASGGTQTVTDETTLVFIEASPGIAINLPGRVSIGAGYRLTYVNLKRLDKPALDFDLTGTNLASFRAGVQWEAVEDHLSLGASYRHKTVTEVTAADGTAIVPMTDLSAEFTLPARLSFGVRGDYHDLGAAVDFEYGFNSQNHQTLLRSATAPMGVANVFEWQDEVTLRVGTEYRFHLNEGAAPENAGGTLAARLGYIFDSKTGNETYPTAFGTPPGPTHVLTGGVGYDGGPWEVNVAYAYRFGGATVTEADVTPVGSTTAAGEPGRRERVCAFCSHPGDYSIALSGIYVDFSYDFE